MTASATPRRLPAHALRRGWVFWLVLAGWLAAQTLGLLHREAHALGAHGDHHYHQGLAAGDCSLFDHAGVADALPAGAMPLPAALAPAALLVLPRRSLRLLAPPPFHARGPPGLR